MELVQTLLWTNILAVSENMAVSYGDSKNLKDVGLCGPLDISDVKNQLTAGCYEGNFTQIL